MVGARGTNAVGLAACALVSASVMVGCASDTDAGTSATNVPSDSTTSSVEPGANDHDFDTFLNQWIVTARQQGASEQQLRLLESAQATGRIDVTLVREAIAHTLDCFEANGVHHQSLLDDSSRGFDVPQYAYGVVEGLTEEESMQVADDCIATHSQAIEFAYQLQPVSVEAEEAMFEALIPELQACLEEQGVALEPDPTWQELVDANMEYAFGEGAHTEPGQQHFDCLGSVVP